MIKWFQCEQADWWVDGWERNRERQVGRQRQQRSIFLNQEGDGEMERNVKMEADRKDEEG